MPQKADGKGQPLFLQLGRHAILKGVQSVQIFILGSSDRIQLLPSPKCGREQGCGCCSPGPLGVERWLPDFQDMWPLGQETVSLGLSLPGFLSPTLWSQMFVTSSCHLLRLHLLLTCSLSSYSLICGGCLLETGSRTAKRGQQRRPAERVGLRMKYTPSLPAGPFLVTCDIERAIPPSLPFFLLGGFGFQNGVCEGTVLLRHCPVSRPAHTPQMWDTASPVFSVPSPHSCVQQLSSPPGCEP